MSLIPTLLALTLLPQTPAPAPDTLARLVPRDTVAYVQVPSLDQLLSAVLRTRAAFAPTSTEPIDIASLLKDLDVPGAAEEIDPKRPMAVCLVLDRDPDAEPRPVFLVPARSPEALAKSLKSSSRPEQALTSIVDGGYVLVALDSKPIERETSPAAIALNLPNGDAVARIDLARLFEQFRPRIDPLLDQLEASSEEVAAAAPGGLNPAPLAGMYVDGLRDLMNSAETFDIAARLAGEHMELAFDLTNKPGSVLASFASKDKTDIRALARYFDPQASMNMLAGMDWMALTRRFHPLLAALPEMYPDPLRDGMRQLFGHVDELSAQLGSALCMGADFDANGMRAAYYLRSKDAGKLLATYKAMLASTPGLSIEAPTESLVDGVPVTSWHMRLDPKAFEPAEGAGGPEAQEQVRSTIEKLYGKDGIVLRIAYKAEVVALVIGGDEAYLRAALGRIGGASQALPADMQRGLDRVSGMSPCFVLRYDLGRMMKGMLDLMSSIAPGAAEEFPPLAFSILAWGGVDGRVWRGALGCDLDEIGSAMRLIEAQSAGRVKHARAQAEVANIRAVLDEFAIKNAGTYPDTLLVLVVKDSNGHAYLEGEHPLIDPWAREYRYEPPSANKPSPRIYSLGRDGKEGGLGEDADVEGL